MAKAKKQTNESKNSTSAEGPRKTAAKGSKKKPAKAAAPAQPAAPMIDTNLAAAMAAKRLTHRDELAAAAKPTAGESNAFKQMKENLHKPSGQNVPAFLQTPLSGKKFNNAIGGRNQQTGRNQTFGADVNRTGVPRRTGG